MRASTPRRCVPTAISWSGARLEEIAGGLFADLKEGRWKEDYEGGRPDLTSSPIPRWDLYRNDRALLGCVQTSRGCPYQCEFCDVIEYLGRKQRFKGVGQVLAELDVLKRLGIPPHLDQRRQLHRGPEAGQGGPRGARRLEPTAQAGTAASSFMTQASIEAAEDEELIRMSADAGLNYVFIGIETPNEASLRETKKTQNLRNSLTESIDVFVRNGIAVRGGMIVGFDSDGPDIFDRMYDFAMSTPIPICNLGSLVAPAATQLYDRMKLEDRLIVGGSEAGATPFDTNIVPKQMGREELLDGIRRLAIAHVSPRGVPAPPPPLRRSLRDGTHGDARAGVGQRPGGRATGQPGRGPAGQEPPRPRPGRGGDVPHGLPVPCSATRRRTRRSWKRSSPTRRSAISIPKPCAGLAEPAPSIGPSPAGQPQTTDARRGVVSCCNCKRRPARPYGRDSLPVRASHRRPWPSRSRVDRSCRRYRSPPAAAKQLRHPLDKPTLDRLGDRGSAVFLIHPAPPRQSGSP